MTFSGDCETGVSIALGGSASGTASCAGGLWSFSPTQTTDGTYPYSFTQTDPAGNVTTINGSWVRSTSGPVITITQSTPQITSGASLTISGTCSGGTAGSNGVITITISGAGTGTASTSCSSINATLGTWSYNASQTTDGSYTYLFSTTDNFSTPRTSQASLVWQRSTSAPLLTGGSFTINGGTNTTTATSYNPVSFAATDGASSITSFCLKTANSAPLSTDSCWYPVNGSQTNVTPSNSVSISNYSFNIGITPQAYSVYLWVMDGAGNISTNTATAGKDTASITLAPVAPPSVSTVLAGNSDTMNGVLSERTITGGSDVYIRWTTSGADLGATPVQLFFTTDDINWTSFATNIANGVNNCATLTGSGTASTTATGCYHWVSGSPTSNYYRVRVAVTNTVGGTTFGNSLPINAGSLQILAGNTETGLNGAAGSAVFQAQYNLNVWGDAQSLVVNSQGVVYFRDITLGLVTVNPANGFLKQLIPLGATTSGYGDGGNITNAKLRLPVSLAIDGSDHLYIYDYDRIRKVDFSTSPGIITTIVGGGTDSTSDTLASGTSLKIVSEMTAYTGAQAKQPLLALPNGDLYFFTDQVNAYYTKRMRTYHASSGSITSLYLSGSSSTIGGSTDTVSNYAVCGVGNPLIAYTPATSAITAFYMNITANYSVNGTNCVPTLTAGGGMYSVMKFNPTTGAVDNSQVPAQYGAGGTIPFYMMNVQSLDGNIYVIDRDEAWIEQFNPTTNAWVRIVGTGVRSSCVDGTAATSCAIDPGGAFVDAGSHLYFIDRGRIRTIVNGNVVTLYGEPFNYGDGGLATNARFGLNYAVQERTDSGIIVHDILTSRMRYFNQGGNISTIAGDDANGVSSNVTTAATSLSLPSSTNYPFFFLDSSNNLYYNEQGPTVNRYLPSTYATNPATTWQALVDSASHAFFSGSTNTYYSPAASGTLAGSVSLLSLNALVFIGFNGTSALFTAVQYSGNYINTIYGEVNVSTGVYTIDMGPGSGNAGFCANGTSLSGCTANYLSIYNAGYDSVNSLWLLMSADGKTIRSIGSGETGTIQTATVFSNAASYFIFKRFSGNSNTYFYYCNSSNGKIYIRNATTSTEAALNWPISSVKCTGAEMVYDSNTDSIIFPFSQNGLYGVAEVSNANPAENGL